MVHSISWDGEEQLGEMVVSIADSNLTVHHTEVSAKAEGKGYAKKMLQAMSIYFRELGGVLFEVATAGPGFATDETIEHLGEELKLPSQFEADRVNIEKKLSPISININNYK